jgi:hypothetical protein
MKEFVKSMWFSKHQPPIRPGVYLTRSMYSGNRTLSWWRAFDGENWRAGIMAASPQGELENVAPLYREAVLSPVIGEHVCIEWCGRSK